MQSERPLSDTPRSRTTRVKERALYERRDLYDVLDTGFVAHLGVVINGTMMVIPTVYGREDDTLFMHGSVGAQSIRGVQSGLPVCVTVTHLDGVVYGRSVFNNSVNYRSAMVHGTARYVEDREEKLHGLQVLSEHMAPGSWSNARLPTKKEEVATAVLALSLEEASVKVRYGHPGNQARDLKENRHWAGTLPIVTTFGAPIPCPLLDDDMAVPDAVAKRRYPPVPVPNRPALPTVMPDGSIGWTIPE